MTLWLSYKNCQQIETFYNCSSNTNKKTKEIVPLLIINEPPFLFNEVGANLKLKNVVTIQ